MVKTIFIKNRKGLKMALRLNINDRNTNLVFLEHGLSSRKEYPHMQVLEDVFSEFGYLMTMRSLSNDKTVPTSSFLLTIS